MLAVRRRFWSLALPKSEDDDEDEYEKEAHETPRTEDYFHSCAGRSFT
jgi:hypothetical protein